MKKVLAVLVILGLASVANAAYSENFDSYTGVPGDFNTLPGYGASGWTNLHDATYTPSGGLSYAYALTYIRASGYSTSVNEAYGNQNSGAARTGLGLAGPNVTVVAIAKVNLESADNDANVASLFLGNTSLTDPNEGGDANFAFVSIEAHGGAYGAYYNHNVNTATGGGGYWDIVAGTLGYNNVNDVDWIELKLEIDLDGSGRPIFGRSSWRDIAEGPPGTPMWIPIHSNAIGTTGAAWTITDAGFQTHVGIRLDELTVTPEPVTLSILALGGLALLRRRR